MELQLGLALPTNPFFPIGYELKQGPFYTNVNASSNGNKRRGFDEDTPVVPKTLSLLLWKTDQPDEEDDPNDVHDNSSSSAILKNEGEGLVGWPPVKAWRKKLRRHVHNGRAMNRCGGRASKSTYVKVKMEGNAIARKIDVTVHGSFESLTSTLMRMFDICKCTNSNAQNFVEFNPPNFKFNSKIVLVTAEKWQKSFKLAYQDTEGDWLLAQDVPWRYPFFLSLSPADACLVTKKLMGERNFQDLHPFLEMHQVGSKRKMKAMFKLNLE